VLEVYGRQVGSRRGRSKRNCEGMEDGFESPKLHRKSWQVRRHLRPWPVSLEAPVGEIWEKRSPPTNLAASLSASR